MKFRVTMKDPDVLQDAIVDAVMDDLQSVAGISERERTFMKEERSCVIDNLAARWFRYGEYLTVEIDTEAQTCTVLTVEQADA
jgi:hypothetical protein